MQFRFPKKRAQIFTLIYDESHCNREKKIGLPCKENTRAAAEVVLRFWAWFWNLEQF